MTAATIGTAHTAWGIFPLGDQSQTNYFDRFFSGLSKTTDPFQHLDSDVVEDLETANFIFFSRKTRGQDFQIFFNDRELNVIHVERDIARAISGSIFDMLEP